MIALRLDALADAGKALFPKLSAFKDDFYLAGGTALAPVSLLAPKELLAMKAYTIGRRGAIKDYVDLWAGISEQVATLAEIIAFANVKYEDAFNDRLFLEQLLYLDDVADEDLTMLGRTQPTKQELHVFFSDRIKKLSV